MGPCRQSFSWFLFFYVGLKGEPSVPWQEKTHAWTLSKYHLHMSTFKFNLATWNYGRSKSDGDNEEKSEGLANLEKTTKWLYMYHAYFSHPFSDGMGLLKQITKQLYTFLIQSISLLVCLETLMRSFLTITSYTVFLISLKNNIHCDPSLVKQFKWGRTLISNVAI